MQVVVQDIKLLFSSFSEETIDTVDKLPQSGSDRIYFRIFTCSRSYIATYNLNKKENNTFIEFSKHFKTLGSPVPIIYASNEEQTIYIQEDFGNSSLLNKLEELGYTPEAYKLFQQSLKELAHMQIIGGK